MLAGFRKLVALLLLMSLVPVLSKAEQDKDPKNPLGKSDDQNLQLITSGETIGKTGHRGAFRIYEASDGARGTVSYSIFNSSRTAEAQISSWVKLAERVTSKEQIKDKNGQVKGERIMAITPQGKNGQREFLIIRRNGLKCYLINSVSLAVAMQLEEGIKP